MAGLIFVFDLDQTLIDSDGIFEEGQNSIYNHLNMTLLRKALAPAAEFRDKGIAIDAICLLTNNSSREFVANVSSFLYELLQSKGRFSIIQGSPSGNSEFPEIDTIFDYIMVRQHASRNGSENPPKTLTDVAYMMNALNIPFRDVADLARRTYFFDDNPSHKIRQQLTTFGYPTHYTLIEGPDSVRGVNKGFIKGKPDLTDYKYIDQVFRRIQRGEDPVPVAPIHVTVVPMKRSIDLPPHLRGRTVAESMKSVYGGRRNKTYMKHLRKIYGRRLTRRRV